LGAHWGGEERGHIVSPRGQLVINVFPPRWSAMTSRVPSSWVAVRGACLAFVHIVIIPVSPLVLLVYKYGTPVQRRSSWPTEFKFGTNLFGRKFRQRIATNLSPLPTTQRGLILQPRRYCRGQDPTRSESASVSIHLRCGCLLNKFLYSRPYLIVNWVDGSGLFGGCTNTVRRLNMQPVYDRSVQMHCYSVWHQVDVISQKVNE